MISSLPRSGNRNTRQAYARARWQFFDWCVAHGLELTTVRPFHVAAWIEDFPGSKPTIKQKLAAVRMLYDFTLGAIERLAGSTIAETLGVNPQESKQIVNRFVPRGILRGVGCADSKIPFSVNLVLGTPKP